MKPKKASSPEYCRNCDEILQGSFCHSCGQDANPAPISAAGFLAEQFSGFLGYDSRLWRTIRTLFFQPGALSRVYLAGKRIPYLSPLSLYLSLASVFFLLHTYHPFVRFDPTTFSIVSSLSAVSIGTELSEAQVRDLELRGISLDLFRERFQNWTDRLFPAFLFGSIILFLAALAMFYRRAGVGVVGHSVVALHWIAFFLALGIVDRIIAILGFHSKYFAVVLSLISLVYLIITLHLVYGQGWVVTALKGFALILWFYILLALWMFSVITITIWMI